ncbi:MAG: ATP-binding protein [Alphaproteobacteria bacterium]
MSYPTIFDLCAPRADVLAGTSSDADFAADLSHVLRGTGGPDEYSVPAHFFANTYPTRGLKNLLTNVCARLCGRATVSAIFRLDTSFGGGKTHGLIALVHAARGMIGVGQPDEFIAPALLPRAPVRIAAFDGENADPANGRRMGSDVLAFTPWGEIAYALAGRDGYERVRKSDEEGIAPGAETIAELFADQPSLILLDELSIYLRKVAGRPGARDQLTAFLTSLFKAVESASSAALVYTLAVGKDGKGKDAYSTESQFIADRMAEAESVSARKATLLNPTEDDETVQVLRRRLFARIDAAGADAAVAAYRALWHGQRDGLGPDAGKPETAEAFRRSYPLHPDMLATFTGKTATLENFQRVRGMLRLLGRTVARLWETRPADATAIHLHHIDPGFEPTRQEIVTRLGQTMYVPAIRNDIAGDGDRKSLAQEIDADSHRGMPPYAVYVARAIFMHTLAFNEQLKGVTPEHLRWSVVGPQVDISFVESARQKFVAQSAYLDDRPGVPLRFLADANLTQIIRRQEQHVDPGELRGELNDRIRLIFGGQTFESVPFPGGPFDVPDEVGNGRPLLAVMSYDACSVGAAVETVPDLVARIWERKGAEGGSLRSLRNNLVFAVADDGRVDEMRRLMTRRLALRALKAAERLAELAEHQQAKVRELEARSEQELAIAIQQCFRHVFYPSRTRVGAASVDLAHSALDIHSASERPGSGQQQVVRALRELRKLRAPEDDPDAPAYVRDRTPLKRGQITTSALREEFRRDVSLPILIGDDVFIKGIRRGVESSEYVYRRNDLLFGPGDPYTAIAIDEQATLFTMAYAREHGIWPRPAPGKPGADGKAGGDGKGGGEDKPDQPHGGLEESGGGIGGKPQPPGSTPDGAPSFSAEGPLREALIRIWEQARTRRAERIAVLTIRLFDAADAFRLLNVVAGARNVDRREVVFEGGYETRDGSSLQIEFRGTPVDAQPLKDFLEPQLRAAAEKTMTARFEMTFDDGLSLTGDAADRLTEQLTRFATGAAYVAATAQAKP